MIGSTSDPTMMIAPSPVSDVKSTAVTAIRPAAADHRAIAAELGGTTDDVLGDARRHHHAPEHRAGADGDVGRGEPHRAVGDDRRQPLRRGFAHDDGDGRRHGRQGEQRRQAAQEHQRREQREDGEQQRSGHGAALRQAGSRRAGPMSDVTGTSNVMAASKVRSHGRRT